MSLNPGQSPHPNATHSETRTAAEAISPGDAVALDANDELVTADDTTDTVVYGIAGDSLDESDYANGDEVEVITDGPVVANVASGVAGGVEVGTSGTEGQLAAGTSVKGLMTMYAEDGSPPESVDSGYTYVDV